MRERWIEYGKKADFEDWANRLGISALTARILKNRGIDTVEEAEAFLHASVMDLPDPESFSEFSRAAGILEQAVKSKDRIAIAADFDTDGIFAGQILTEGLQRIGGESVLFTPDRLEEGYGLNRRIVDDAIRRGCALILTCDNGIAALDAVRYAKEQGLTVVVTDHHEAQFAEEDGERTYLLPEADAIVDPKCPGSEYPFPYLCGAGVAFRLIEVLYRRFGIPEEALEELYEYVAIATIADIVELKGENRVLVRTGLQKLRHTEKIPLRALLEVLEVEPESLGVYHVSFLIAPCFNAIGRISDIRLASCFLNEKNDTEALEMARRIRDLNESRKEMTETGYQAAEEAFLSGGHTNDPVAVVTVPGIHESVVGIIAGRLKENYHRPVFVLTDSKEPGIYKGSGRSIDGYHMANALMGVRELLEKCGGHAMAAGLTVKESNIDLFRATLNDQSTLTERELTPTVRIDARAPLSYMTVEFTEEIERLEPFGTGNPRPLFARPDFLIESLRVIGKNGNVLKMRLSDGTGRVNAVYFGDPEIVYQEIRTGYGEEALQGLLQGLPSGVRLAFTYYPTVDVFRGEKRLEIVCRNCCRIAKKEV